MYLINSIKPAPPSIINIHCDTRWCREAVPEFEVPNAQTISIKKYIVNIKIYKALNRLLSALKIKVIEKTISKNRNIPSKNNTKEEMELTSQTNGLNI